MIHYIVLMQENIFSNGQFQTLHYYKKGSGNEIPTFHGPTINWDIVQANLRIDDFKLLDTELTIEEIILQDIAEITVFFFNKDGSFHRTGIFRRIVSNEIGRAHV